MTSQQSTPPSISTSPAARHEPENVFSFGVLLVNGSLLLLVIFALFFVSTGFNWFAADPGLAGASQTWELQQTSPGVKPNQAYDRERLQAAEQELLHSYGWQDDQHEHARIPIERAMHILAESNLQLDWPQAEPDRKSEEISSKDPASGASEGRPGLEKAP